MKFKYDDLFKRIVKVKSIVTAISEEELEDMFPTYKSVKVLREMGVKETEIKATIDSIADEANPRNNNCVTTGLSTQQVYFNEAVAALDTIEDEFSKHYDETMELRNALLELLDTLNVLDPEPFEEVFNGLASVCCNEGHELDPFVGEEVAMPENDQIVIEQIMNVH